ncbi:hypothetical protein SAZ11_51580 [Streptomyces sp. FXJ1.4098]|uniref:hypothetical protein n=1 Tax=Streptomyces sp. NPDC020845 TaxID=3365096 RepID=UPI002994DCC1|nr:hypothetical protein [Streptomyces sp. FXJ1.4098]
MRRIDAEAFQGSPQAYVAQLDVTTEGLESRWGPHELTRDDLGDWFTFAFALDSGTLVALVREVEHAPHPGYILTAIGGEDPRAVLTEFLAESGLSADRVTHQGFG